MKTFGDFIKSFHIIIILGCINIININLKNQIIYTIYLVLHERKISAPLSDIIKYGGSLTFINGKIQS